MTGWWFGFGYFLAGLYWVGYAFLVDAETFGWLLPIAVAGLPAGLAFFTALGCALARAMWTRGPVRILALAVALTLVEWLRGHVLTGFPWNTYGYALTGPLVLAQAASLFGIWGLTFLAVAVFASPATLTDDPVDTRRRWLPLAASLIDPRCAGNFRRRPAGAQPDQLRQRRASAPDAAEYAAGRQVQLFRRSRR